jgi:hypothetical protein
VIGWCAQKCAHTAGFFQLWLCPLRLSRLNRPEVLVHTSGGVPKVPMRYDVVPAIDILVLVT